MTQLVTQASACGKFILFGEHFVLYGSVAVALPLKAAKLKIRCEITGSGMVEVNMPSKSVNTTMFSKAVQRAVEFLGIEHSGLKIDVSGDLPIGAGLGSSAAYSVACAKCLHKLAGYEQDQDWIANTALEMEKIFHGSPSGIDSTTIAFETACFVKLSPDWKVRGIKQTPVPKAGFVDVPKGGMFLIADSGDRGSTKKAVEFVKKLLKNHKNRTIFEQMTTIAESLALMGSSALRKGEWKWVGKLMTENHLLLHKLGLSTPKLDSLCAAAIKAGAYGAKLTGAGFGGCVVAAGDPKEEERLRHAFLQAGAVAVITEFT